MRKSYLLLAGAGVAVLAACSGDKKTSMNDDLKKDLELASSSDGITLANSSSNAGQQVISAIERTTPPARQQTPSSRVRKHKAAPKAPPQVVQAQARATVTQTEEQSVARAPGANDPIPVSPRPQPVAVSYPSGSSSGGDDGRVSGGGSSAGAIIGSILGAVIRGGVVGDVDQCDPRTDGRRGSTISINNRLPYPVPGRGRIGSRSSSGPSIGGIPIGRIPRF
ncbi:MAG: hypothetical protein ABI469_06430 [Gemmatimonadales bacterium]